MSQDQINKPVQGTREWAVATVDCCIGCPHGCLYCYARYKQVNREKLLTAEEWDRPQVIHSSLTKRYIKYDGQVMFPAYHDIVPENLQSCITVLKKLLDAGNRVLVVSKPHLDCIKELSQELSCYRQQLLFRFTITGRDPDLLSFWEPNAPSYSERLSSLVYLFENGFKTSVSVEPMLDRNDVTGMVTELVPFVTDSIWIGKMNKLDKRVKKLNPAEEKYIAQIKQGQTAESIQNLYNELKNISEIRWKESIKDVLGLPRADQYGLDI